MKIIYSLKGIVFIMAFGIALGFASLNKVGANTGYTLGDNPQRIVALTSLMADVIQRLDSSKLVGIPGSKLLINNPSLRGISKVSEGRAQPNLEKILSLRPDGVIGARGFHEQTATRLNRSGITTELVEVDSWEALEQVTKDLAKKLGANPEPLLSQYRKLSVPNPKSVPRVLVLVSRQPILSPNRKSWAGAMLDRFHLKNVADELQGKAPFEGYITLSPEKLLKLNPDTLIVVETGESILQQFQQQSFWRNLQAVQKKRVYQFDYYGLVNPGSIDTIVKASEKLKEISQEN